MSAGSPGRLHFPIRSNVESMRATFKHALVGGALCGLLFPSCIATVDTERPGSPEPRVEASAATSKEAKESKDEDPEKKARQAAYKAEDRDHERAQAQLELRLAQMDGEASLTKARHELEDAKRELAEKQRALEVFLQHQRPQRLAEGQLSLDQAFHRRELQQDELNELIAMYEAEDFAELTKELVLKRGRKGLEFAERNLELQRKGETLTKQERDLNAGVEKAQRAVDAAAQALDKAELEQAKKLAGAEHKLQKLDRPIED